MDEEKKREMAVFRFGVISDFVTPLTLERGEQEKLLREKCARRWSIPHSRRTRLSRAVILSWIRAYLAGGRRLEALSPQERSDRGRPRALDDETAASLIVLRRELPRVTVRVLIQEALRRRIVSPEVHLAPTTVYRFLQSQGLLKPPAATPEDRRRFEAELPNDIWQSDALHGPMVMADGKTRKAYLFAFIDDMSRLVTGASFYPSERMEAYVDCFRRALLSRGLPRKLYVDNGSTFRSHHLADICASLGIALAHSPPYQPQGRGKVERWFRTVRDEFLATFTGKTIEDLNTALDAWIRDTYHTRLHRGTGETPLRRFTSHVACLRQPPPDLEDHFRLQARRRVAKDRTVALNGTLLEAPVPLIGKQIILLFHLHDPSRVEARHEGKSYGMLRPVNPNVNCRVRRRAIDQVISQETPPPEPRPPEGGKLTFRQEECP
jgi:putative transposase